MKENQENQNLPEVQPNWYLNLREFRIEINPGEVPGTVEMRRTLDRSFKDAIQANYVDKAKGDDVIDIEGEVIKDDNI